jgi:hypothetical protein
MRLLYPSWAKFGNVTYFSIFWNAGLHFPEAEWFITHILTFVEVCDEGEFLCVWEGFRDVILGVYFFLGKAEVDHVDNPYIFYCVVKLGG